MPAKKKPAFETGLEQLEEIIRRMEEDALPLEEALAAYEQGVRLYQALSAQLDQSEKQLQILAPASPEREESV